MTTSTNTNARWIGVLMIPFALLSALLCFVFVMSSQYGWKNEAGTSLTTGLSTGLITLWLFLAGIALIRRRPAASLRAPGVLAMAGGVLGIAALLPQAFGNDRVTEFVKFAWMLLPGIFGSGVAGAGHILSARGKNGLPLYLFGVLGFLGSILMFALLVFRIVK